MTSLSRRIALSTLCLLLTTCGSFAQTPESFFRGKQISLYVFSGAGSTYDVYSRLLARHLGNNIPGKPTVIVQYMQGAGGLKLVDYINRIAPKDGAAIGMIGRGLPFEPLLGKNEVNFDPLKLNWIGSMNREVTVALSWMTAKVKTFEDLTKIELLVPGTGAGADSEIMPRAFNNLAGTKFKIIMGYRETTEASLQLETGELDGIAYWSWSSVLAAHPDWLRDKKINLLFKTGHKDLPGAPPDLPVIQDLVRNPTDRKALDFLLAREPLGRPVVAPPGLSPERAKTLRDSFAATMIDPAFRAEADRSQIEVNPVSGAEVEAILKEAASAPPDVIDLVKRVLDR